MHIRLLDKYVLKELLYPFVFGIASFSSIFIASSMLFKIVQYITTYNAPLWTVARLLRTACRRSSITRSLCPCFWLRSWLSANCRPAARSWP